MSTNTIKLFHLTHAQRRIWYTELLYPNTTTCVLSGTAVIRGNIDLHVLRQAIDLVIQQNEAFRIKLTQENGEPMQYIEPHMYKEIEFLDFSEYNHAARAEEWLGRHNRTPMELLHSDLYQFVIFKLSDEHYWYNLKMHHIVSDGISMNLIGNQVAENYVALKKGALSAREEKNSYIDYISAERQYEESERFQKDKAYWMDKFQSLSEVASLKSYNPLVTSTAAERKSLIINDDLYRNLTVFSQQNKISVLTFFMSTVYIYMHKVTNRNDIAIGTIYANRTTKKEKDTIGMFASTVATKIFVDPELDLLSFLQRVAKEQSANLRHQKYPYNQLIQDLREKHNNKDIQRLFGIAVEYQPMRFLEYDQISTQSKIDFSGHEGNDFVLHIKEMLNEQHIVLDVHYRTHLFEEKEVQRIQQQLLTIAEHMIRCPFDKIAEVSLINDDEKNTILTVFNDTWADYPREKTIHGLFEEQAERAPEQVAVVFEDEKLTYRELNEKANRLARTLRAEGVRPDQPVVIMTERSLDMIVGILGILKAGGAYVPIDPEYPEERIRYMLEDSGTKTLVLQRRFMDRVSFAGALVMLDDERLDREDGSNLEPAVGPNHLAYVIYTSGTTGKPKGVMVEHGSIANTVQWKTASYRFSEEDRALMWTPFVFDPFITHFFGPVVSGSTVYMLNDEASKDPMVIKKTIVQQKITHLQGSPSFLWPILETMEPQELYSVKSVVAGGEKLAPALIQKLMEMKASIEICNEYGPTENSVVSTRLSITDAAQEITIGKPIANTVAYILSKEDQLQPVGIPGELCVAGAGLARGYLNRPELTAEKFIDNPFVPGARMYRTGDLARWLPDGNIEYLGRIDHQVKIRGHRIELGEVEAHLLKAASVLEAVVFAREDEAGQKQLCAYYVADRELTAGELRRALSREMPGYMVPSYFVQLAQMPLTPNGKIDHRALPAPEGGTQTGIDYVAARTPMEERLEQIWKKVLGLPKVGIKDNFFEIGGHSLRATTLVAHLHKELDIEMSLREVFQYPTIEQMAEAVTGREQSAYASIPMVEKSAYYPVSSAQKRLYILSQLEGGELSYNMPGAMTVEGVLDRKRLEEAFRKLIARHDTLRTGFELVNGEPVQRIHETVQFAVEFAQVSGEEAEAHVREFVRPFDLRQAPLLRVGLIELKPDRHLLLVDMHHIISDGASMGILVKEFIRLYEGDELPPLRIQYKDYAAWQQGEVQSRRLRKQEAYWLEMFRGNIPVLDLPTDYKRPSIRSFKGSTLEFVLDKQKSEGLRQLATQTGSTLFMVLLAAYTTLLSKYSGQEDMVVGTPIAGRPHADLEPILGMFVNTLAIRNAPAGEKTFRDYVQEVKESALRAYENQDYPFEELVDKLDVARDMSRNALFDTMFVLQNTEQEELDIEGLEFRPYANKHNVSKFELTFNVTEEADSLVCSIEYASTLFKQETILRMAEHFTQLVEKMIHDPNAKLSSIEILTAQEKAQIVEEFNDTAWPYLVDMTIHGLFEQVAAGMPEQEAVVFQDQRLTYRELNERANRLARTLRAKGLQAEQLVAIMSERSIEMIVAVLAVMKAGGAYVPVDPEYPEKRICYMLEDSGARLLLVQSHLRDRAAFDGEALLLDDDQTYSDDGSNLGLAVDPQQLAYVIYTSGTTGNPKGVMVEHQGVCNFKFFCENTLQIGKQDRIVQFASFSFDASCSEIIMSLFFGAMLYVPDASVILDHHLFEQYVRDNGITVATLPPTYAVYLNPAHVPSLKTLITAGSASSAELVGQWKDHVRYINNYGPTEDSICSTTWVYSQDMAMETSVPIGRPIANHQVYILDAQNRLAPIGVAGELCVSGIGLARGYLNRPELTAEKFVPVPFAPEKRMYRTGDLARWLPDGNIEYLGRIDHQVKIRGYRIELGEVEAHLLKAASVLEAIVFAREDEAGQKQLCAYYVADRELTAGELRRALSREMPGYMVPSYFVQLAQMPLTPNGKIDHRALPAPEGRTQTGIDYVAARTPMEERLEQIWKKVLGLPKVGVKDNFFEIGGHSLRATTLVAHLHKELDIEMSLREVFQYPTIEQMAEAVTGREQSAYASIPMVEKSAYYPVSSAQKRLYILSQLEGGELSYNMPEAMTIEGALDRKRLEEAFRKLIARHDTLRTGFELVNGEPVQRIHETVPFAVEFAQAGEDEAEARVREFVRPFDLRQAPLLRVGLIELKPDRHLLLVDMHHIISDGASMGILTKEFIRLYEGDELPPLRIQYKDYAAWQQGEVQSRRSCRQEAYWLETFRGDIPVLDLPTDYKRPSIQSFKGSTLEFVIDKQKSEGLRQLAAQTGSTLFMVLLAAYTTLLSKYSGQEDVIVGTPIAGRPHADLEPILGMFVNTLAIRNAPAGEKTFRDYVQEVKESALRAYENQDYPFEELVDKLDVARDLSRNALFDTMFVLQNTEQEELDIEGLEFRPYANKHNVSKFDLTFSAIEDKEQILCSIEYATSLYKPETIERMAKHFIQLIDVIASDPQVQLSSLEIITAQEKEQILHAWGETTADYPREKTISQLFEEQADRTPDQVAVVFEEKRLTYSELNEKANRLARTLRAEGVGPDQFVGIMAERSLEMIVGIMAILKAGGAYVPIDPEYPQERISYMLEDSGAKLLLLHRHLQDRISFAGTLVALDEEAFYHEKRSNLEAAQNPNHLAYVIYTSGTTGKPKGVMIEHRQLVSIAHAWKEAYDLNKEAVRVLQWASFSFDVFSGDLVRALLHGGTLIVCPNHSRLDPTLIYELIAVHRISFFESTPALMIPLMEYVYDNRLDIGSLKTLIVGSDQCPAEAYNNLVDRFGSHMRILNSYGVTEACIDACYYEYTSGQLGESLPIGKPLPNVNMYILGPNAAVQPVGIPGELYIGGSGVGRGYLNRPELTAEKFADNPFAAGGRIYRTGDLARWLPDGNIEYLGRVDHQVKIRGFRIELGEIEAQLMKAPSVQEAVVTAREDETGQKQLVAYFVADKDLTVSELRETLAQELPGYMMPSYFVQLARMPLTSNGKVDRKVLPAPEGSVQTGVEYLAARTPLEAKLVQIWQDVLGLRNFGVKDNFFDLGGHSLKVLQLMQKIHAELEIDIPLRVVFEKPSIEKMANELLKLRFHKIEHSGRHIVKLNENGLINVFCFPPVLGYGMAFAEMAKHLDRHCVVYSIEFIEDDYARPDMLDQYMDSILSIQEKSPYVFLGYSAGGNLAFEVAKVMEKRGYSVSDIIIIDAMKKNSRIEASTEEAENHLNEVLKEIPEPYRQILTAPVTRDKVRSKTLAYDKYWNELVNTGVVQANIHGLVAESSKEDHSVQDNVLLWKEATQQNYAEHNLVGEHIEVLMPGYVEENAKVLRLILKHIGEQAGLGLVSSSGTL
ncbi:non-ribosomal peptide synthetase [Paenibacillus tyrfis]|uniref:non-ribosomal peptide synthetase n=1 Tax=Paenibacillus tyrfis TaxID=1501230 RepID=UPI00068B581C|nr:non-ribosomal peptide synthetase [Paenibacillus tyrfis]